MTITIKEMNIMLTSTMHNPAAQQVENLQGQSDRKGNKWISGECYRSGQEGDCW